MKYLKADIRTFEADIVRVAGTDELFFAHPLEVRATEGLALLDDGTIAGSKGVDAVERLRSSGFLAFTDWQEVLKAHPDIALICEAKVAQEGPGLVDYWADICRYLDESSLTDRFIVASHSRREVRAAWKAGVNVGIFTGDDPDDTEFSPYGMSIYNLPLSYYFPDPFRIRRDVIEKIQFDRAMVAPYVLGHGLPMLKAMAEKMLGWGCSMVMCDRADELVG